MKLIFDMDLDWSGPFSNTWSADELANAKAYYEEVFCLAKSISLGGKYLLTDKGVSIKIFGQKITVEEHLMSKILCDFFSEFWETDIRYTPLGGGGVDICLSIMSASPHDYGGDYVKDFQP